MRDHHPEYGHDLHRVRLTASPRTHTLEHAGFTTRSRPRLVQRKLRCGILHVDVEVVAGVRELTEVFEGQWNSGVGTAV